MRGDALTPSKDYARLADERRRVQAMHRDRYPYAGGGSWCKFRVQELYDRLTMPLLFRIRWEVEDIGESMFIKLTTFVPCRDRGHTVTIVHGFQHMWPTDERHALEMANEMLRSMMIHEMDEHVLMDGKRWNDPH